MSIDFAKARKEHIRWIILTTLEQTSLTGATDQVIQTILQALLDNATIDEIRKEMNYLESRKLLKIESRNAPAWRGTLTREGIDVCDYTVDVEPGIARPKKWA